MLGIVIWYAVFIAGTIALLFAWWASRRGSSYPRLRCWTLSHIIYPLFPSLSRIVSPLFPSLRRRRRWTRFTYIDLIILGVYLLANGFCLGFGIDGLDERGTSALMRRSGLLSSVNTVMLFPGGRTNVFIDAFGIPLHTYYLAHHWIGRIAIAQALLHAGLAISQKRALDARTISGIVVASALILILSASLRCIRGIWFELFLITHMLLALTAIGGVIWHLLPGEPFKLLFPIISISVWSITTLLVRKYRNRGSYIISYNIFSQPGRADPRLYAVKFTLRVPRHLDAKPGYLYLHFSGLRWRYRFQAHPFMIVWCEDGVEDKDGGKIDITDLTFLVQPRGGLTASLGRELRLSDYSSIESSFRSSVTFDGPYGQDLHLEDYETVMLVAEGIGIAGVLPYAQHLAQRSHHDAQIKRSLKLASTPNKDDLRRALHRDTTRNVDLFWNLELNDQERWVSEQLRNLQDLDPGRRTNMIYCYYPEEKTSEPLIKLDKGWKCIYPEDQDKELTLDEVIQHEAGKSRRNVIVACGNATFTQDMRKKVLETMSKDNIIEFAEVEYRPRGFRNQDDAKLGSARLLKKRQHTRVMLPDPSEEVELAQLPTREARNVLSKAPGMQVMGKIRE